MKHNEQVRNDVIFQLEKQKNHNAMTYEQKYFDEAIRNNLITFDNIQKLQQAKEMITHLVVCWTIIISKAIKR